MIQALICDGVRTPIGRYGGGLSGLRTDDLAAAPLRELCARNRDLDPAAIEDVFLGCANQAGEDNRNVARMAALLAGLPVDVPGVTLNRLCASGMDAVIAAARALRAGDMDLVLAGGVESMSRAPFVMPKAETAFARANSIYDTTIGWRFPNPAMADLYGIDSMPQTADNVAADFDINRADQDAFALGSQQKYAAAQAAGAFDHERMSVSVPQAKGEDRVCSHDEHPRPQVTWAQLAKLRGVNGPDRSVTAGNSSGVNDGAAALILATEAAAKAQGLTPIARVVGSASAGVPPRIMGIGPVPATQKVLAAHQISLDQLDLIELNEAFAAQSLATLRQLDLDDTDPRVNPQGGAIALGHPLGMSGARLVLTAAHQLRRSGGRYALCTMCVGVGQGTTILIERL